MNSIEEIQQAITPMVTEVEKFEVSNQLNYNAAANYILDIKTMKKKIKQFFDPTIEQFKKAKGAAEKGRKAEVERMEKFLSPVEDAENSLMLKCKSYENEQARIAEEERKRKEEEAAKARELLEDNELAEKIEEEAKEIEPEINRVAGLGIRRTWKWRVTDPNKIPREFLVIDTIKINAIVRNFQDKEKIEGIEVYFE